MEDIVLYDKKVKLFISVSQPFVVYTEDCYKREVYIELYVVIMRLFEKTESSFLFL